MDVSDGDWSADQRGRRTRAQRGALLWIAAPVALLALASWLAVTDAGGYPTRHPAVTLSLAMVAGILLGALTGWRLGRESQARRSATTPGAPNRDLAAAAAEVAGAHRELAAVRTANAALEAELTEHTRCDEAREERWRLARETHATLAQHLSAIGAQLEAALAGRRGWAQRVTLARELAREGLAEAHHSLHALTPPTVEGDSGKPAG